MGTQQSYQDNSTSDNNTATIAEPRCSLCHDVLTDATIINQVVTSFCDHDHDLCHLCVKNSIKTQLDTKGWKDIQCPYEGCRERLGIQDVQISGGNDVLEKYISLPGVGIVT